MTVFIAPHRRNKDRAPVAGGHHLDAAAAGPVGLEHPVAVPQVAHQHERPAPGQQSGAPPQ